ncbi:MAG: hypothetical protein HY841_07585 [Bacteroidetes bacterium]|nr:hypothetical protein [Bacteroidota bacterium]
MAKGVIKSLYPPGNNGSRNGAGQITEDVTLKKYVFQTPADVDPASVPLSVGTPVVFDANGNQAGGVKLPPPPTCTLTANPTSIKLGESVTLSWTSENADTITIDNGVGNVTPVAAGSKTVTPTDVFTYNLTAANSSGQTATASITIQLNAPVPGDR